MPEMKKFYVVSGEIRVIGMAITPMVAAVAALQMHGNNCITDSTYFFVDELGLRTDNAEWKIPIEEVLDEAGFHFFDDDDKDGGISCLVESDY